MPLPPPQDISCYMEITNSKHLVPLWLIVEIYYGAKISVKRKKQPIKNPDPLFQFFTYFLIDFDFFKAKFPTTSLLHPEGTLMERIARPLLPLQWSHLGQQLELVAIKGVNLLPEDVSPKFNIHCVHFDSLKSILFHTVDAIVLQYNNYFTDYSQLGFKVIS